MLSDFITRHGLPKFTLRILRISAIRGSLFETKNIRLVQRLANHASRISTLVYAESKEALEICDAIIADGQASFRQFLLIDLINQKAISSMLKVDIETARAIAAGKYATLSGFTCRNPYEGKAPGSVAGELCEHFLACFRCENAVLGKDAMSAGRLIQFRDALLTDKTKMRPERFEFLYGWVVMSLERFILPLYTPAVLQEGTRIAKTLPPLPSFVE